MSEVALMTGQRNRARKGKNNFHGVLWEWKLAVSLAHQNERDDNTSKQLHSPDKLGGVGAVCALA